MEAWRPPDTIRRSGFGHALVNRRHALTFDRGVSLVVLPITGPPLLTEYRAGLFAPVIRGAVAVTDVSPCYR